MSRSAKRSRPAAVPPPEGNSEREASEGARRRLSARLALAFTVRWLPSPHHLGDARVFSTGRLGMWTGFTQLSLSEQQRICRFRLICARGLEQDSLFLEECLPLLQERDSFEALGKLPASAAPSAAESIDEADELAKLELSFTALHPTQLDEDIRRWMKELEESRSVGRVHPAPSLKGERLTLHAWSGTYAIPRPHLPTQTPEWPTLSVTPPREIILDREALLTLADQLDQAHQKSALARGAALPTPFRLITLRDRLLNPMRQGQEDAPLKAMEGIEAGILQLMVAPTGTGKSVLTTVLALHQASLGVPIALVVPQVNDVWETTFELERDIQLLQAFMPEVLPRPLKVASLSSSRRRFAQLALHLAHAPAWDPLGEWVLGRFGYACALRAYRERSEDEQSEDGEPSPEREDEPCHGSATSRGPKATQRACPFLDRCPKHTSERDALTADIIVINHHALLMGMHRLPTVRREDPVARRRPLLETVLARCGLVVLDEVDALQKSLIDQDAGNLSLASRGPVSPIHRLFADLEIHTARSDKPLTPHHDRTRRELMSIQTAAQELTHLLERDLIDWQAPPHLRFHGSSDREICRALFRPAADETELGHADYETLHKTMTEHRHEAPAHLRSLQQAFQAWAEIRLDDPRTSDERLEALGHVLEKPLPGGYILNDTKQQARFRDLLALRATLWRLERTLHQLGLVLPELSRLALPSAEPVLEALSSSRVATLSPLGPLGMPVYGFSWQGREGTGSPLRTLALRGDPHGDLVYLGDTLALALAGHRRAVLGLSATAWFVGSSLCHVHGALRFLRPDPENSVTCLLEPSKIEISGVTDPAQRLKNCVELGRELWPRLEAERGLLRLSGNFPGQDKLLLVTGSYDEAHSVAHGVGLAMGGQPRCRSELWAVQRTHHPKSHYHAITHREIETFGKSDAWILVAPLTVVARGHNILQGRAILAEGSTLLEGLEVDPTLGSRSALGSIYLLVRPVPPLSDASRLLAHVTAERHQPSSYQPASQGVTAERSLAWNRYRHFMWGAGALSSLPEDIRHEVICDVLVELAQLAGRARRGGTQVRIHLVDGAFQRRGRSWSSYLTEAFAAWRRSGVLPKMVAAHGAFLRALASIAGENLEQGP